MGRTKFILAPPLATPTYVCALLAVLSLTSSAPGQALTGLAAVLNLWVCWRLVVRPGDEGTHLLLPFQGCPSVLLPPCPVRSAQGPCLGEGKPCLETLHAHKWNYMPIYGAQHAHIWCSNAHIWYTFVPLSCQFFFQILYFIVKGDH